MGSRKPYPREWWEEETQFIESESRKRFRMGEFSSYCCMQARFADKDGFSDLAERIRTAERVPYTGKES